MTPPVLGTEMWGFRHFLNGLLLIHMLEWQDVCSHRDTSFESHQQKSDKFSYCPIRHKYWKTQMKGHFSGLCYLLKLRSPQFLVLSEHLLVESRKSDCQTLSYPLAAWATGRKSSRTGKKWKCKMHIHLPVFGIWDKILLLFWSLIWWNNYKKSQFQSQGIRPWFKSCAADTRACDCLLAH